MNAFRANAPELREAIDAIRPHIGWALFFSLFSNLLAVTPTIYIMQVYDRVLTTRSGITLGMLTLLAMGMFVLMVLFELVRAEIMRDAGLRMDQMLGDRVFNVVFEGHLRRVPGGLGSALSDLRTLRDFLPSPAGVACLDLPFAIVFIVMIYTLNPIMGHFAVVGAIAQVGMTLLQEKRTQAPLTQAGAAMGAAQGYASGVLRNSQVMAAMGMLYGIHNRWRQRQNKFLQLQATASQHAGLGGVLSKFILISQITLMMGVGCWLSIKGLMGGSGIIMLAAALLGGRGGQALTTLVTSWRMIVQARDSFDRLDKMLQAMPQKPTTMSLPAPAGNLTVEGVFAGAPGGSNFIVRGVTLGIRAGEVLAIIGPSASGKTTLARLLVGVWPAASGKVRLDGVDVYDWNKQELGPYLGYLPQDVELFGGTLAENISRFGTVNMDKVIAAAKIVGVHEMVMALPKGYDSQVGADGCFLSGGQRQRIGLARAIYGTPRVVVLDEPNASLDEEGDAALIRTLQSLKADGVTVVIISHLTSVLAAVDSIAILQDGTVKIHGPRNDVLAALYPAPQRGRAAAPGGQAQP